RVQSDLTWHLEELSTQDDPARRRLAQRRRRLVAERQERALQSRLERLFGVRLVAWWERGVLAALLGILALVAVPVLFDLSLAEERAVLWTDAVLCLFFLWDFGFKAVCVRGNPRWLARHMLTDLLPALPFSLVLLAAPAEAAAEGVAAGLGAQKARSVLILRLLRLPRLVRYVRLALPLIRVGRALGFMLRGFDRLVRRHGALLDRDVILYPTSAERRQSAELAHSPVAALWRLAAQVDRLWLAGLESPGRDADREALAEARVRVLRSALDLPWSVAQAQGGPPPRRCAEDLLERLIAIPAEEIEGELGAYFVERVARAVRAVARSPLRWLPILRAYVPPAPDEITDSEVTARFTRGAAARLLGHLRRIQWVADLHGTVTPSELVGRVGTTLVRRTARPALRLLMLGGAFLLLKLLLNLIGGESLEGMITSVENLLGTTLLVLGSLCFLLLALGIWLQRLASDTSTSFSQIASAQFLHLTESIKVRALPRDADLLTERVFTPERVLRGEHPQSEEDRRIFLQSVRIWLTEGVPVECSDSGFDPIARTVLMYRDVLDGALLAETDTRATSQLLGNLALKRIRRRSGRVDRRQIKALERLDLEHRRSLLGGPYLWFNLIASAITQQTARLIVDYNDHAVPLDELERSAPHTRKLYRDWLLARSSQAPESSAREARRSAGHAPLTTAFTALHFLDDAPERDEAIGRRFGGEVLKLLRRDRQALFRRIFGTFPLHDRPTEQRVLNLRSLYRYWIEGGRVLLLPLRLMVRGGRGALRGLRTVTQAVRSIRDPRLAYVGRVEGGVDFRDALRKIDRMRVPAAEACLWQRALTDVEYLGIPIPGHPGASSGAPLVEADLDFLSASHAFRERVGAERQCAAADMRRLQEGIAGGWLEAAGKRVAQDFVPAGEHLRAAAVAFRADYDGLRAHLAGRAILHEVYSAAAAVPARSPRVLPRPRLWLAFRAYWALHGVGDAVARRRAWRATVHDVEGVAAALAVWRRLGEERARDAGEELLAEVLRHPGQVTEQVVCLRAVQTLSLIDVRNYRVHVRRMGGFDEVPERTGVGFRIGAPSA
ncbi:MAG: hypothetical protein V3T22_00965, partial [Planctomycetota bacterium]